jgi:hypothetical protein
MRVCRNSHKLKITLATGSCSEGDFDKEGILTHLHFVYYNRFISSVAAPFPLYLLFAVLNL